MQGCHAKRTIEERLEAQEGDLLVLVLRHLLSLAHQEDIYNLLAQNGNLFFCSQFGKIPRQLSIFL